MNEIPTQVQIGAFTFTIDVDQAYLDRHGAQRGEELSGLSEFEKQKITISDVPGEDFQADTVLHEILHMCLQVVNSSMDGESEEKFVGSLTGILLDTLRRNPEIVYYLMGKHWQFPD